MKAKQNFSVSLVFLGLALFEVIVYIEIIGHPYMVGLLLFLCAVTGYHFGLGLSKSLKK